jgi:hypothetical protein
MAKAVWIFARKETAIMRKCDVTMKDIVNMRYDDVLGLPRLIKRISCEIPAGRSMIASTGFEFGHQFTYGNSSDDDAINLYNIDDNGDKSGDKHIRWRVFSKGTVRKAYYIPYYKDGCFVRGQVIMYGRDSKINRDRILGCSESSIDRSTRFSFYPMQEKQIYSIVSKFIASNSILFDIVKFSSFTVVDSKSKPWGYKNPHIFRFMKGMRDQIVIVLTTEYSNISNTAAYDLPDYPKTFSLSLMYKKDDSDPAFVSCAYRKPDIDEMSKVQRKYLDNYWSQYFAGYLCLLDQSDLLEYNIKLAVKSITENDDSFAYIDEALVYLELAGLAPHQSDDPSKRMTELTENRNM